MSSEDALTPSSAGAAPPAATPPPRPAGPELHRVNPNCCYQACPRCSSVRRLREFQARHPGDWRARLQGLPRLVALAQQRE